MMFKKVSTAFVVLALAGVPFAMGQNTQQATETEEAMVIRESSTATDRYQNLMALQFIEGAIAGGNKGPEVHAGLGRLLLAGHMNQVVSGGRVINNYPDIRLEAARLLGTIGSEEAKAILIQACRFEPDGAVLQEVINSIAGISAGDDAGALTTIVEVASRSDRLGTGDNRTALAAVNAIATISGRTGGLTSSHAFRYLVSVSRGPYVPTVTGRAKQVLDGLHR